MHRVTHLAIEQGVTATRSIAASLQAVMAPLPPGGAGGIVGPNTRGATMMGRS